MMGKYTNLFISVVGCWFLICSCVSSSDSSENEESKCKSIFTYGYGYRQFYNLLPNNVHLPNGDVLHMKFLVKARSDAHILLSTTPSPEESDPVYEIVIGAGKNSFSDIRRRRRAATKSTVLTKDILSGTELRGFWVKITHEGYIQVGQEDNDIPFMEWQDPDPLHIEYFSFCTWSGVVGKWLLNCSDDQTGSVEVQPTLTVTEKLRKALLTKYDVYSRPVANASQLMDISIQIQTTYVQLDAKKSVMTVGCVFTLIWNDEKMVWDPNDFSNLSRLQLIHHEIWQPQLIHFNAVGKGVSPLAQTGMQVTSNGQVTWRPHSRLQSRCYPDLRQWPWDTQKCKLRLGFWNQPDSLKLLLLENGTKLELQKTNSEWVLEKLDAETVIIEAPWLTDPTAFSSDGSDDTDTVIPTAITFTFTLKRVNIAYYYVFVIPLFVIVVMSLTCFWMDPLSKEKLATNCLLLLLLCGFLLRLESSLSAPADHTPYLFKIYGGVLVVVACATVLTVMITSLVSMSHHRSPPRFICSVLTSPFMTSLFCLPRPKPKEEDYGQLSETGERSDSLPFVADPLGYDSGANHSWCLLTIFCDRVAFIAALIAYTTVFVC